MNTPIDSVISSDNFKGAAWEWRGIDFQASRWIPMEPDACVYTLIAPVSRATIARSVEHFSVGHWSRLICKDTIDKSMHSSRMHADHGSGNLVGGGGVFLGIPLDTHPWADTPWQTPPGQTTVYTTYPHYTTPSQYTHLYTSPSIPHLLYTHPPVWHILSIPHPLYTTPPLYHTTALCEQNE